MSERPVTTSTARRPKSVVITGASRGLGAAIAELYARDGCDLGLIGRDAARLHAVAARCGALGATVSPGIVDVTCAESTETWMRAHDARFPIDLLIVNAGVFNGHGRDRPEDAAEIADIIRTNLDGAIHTINAALPMLRDRRRGTIAIITSLAALYPLADAPAYSASKGGLKAYGEALREWLWADGIKVCLVYPGHIRTQQVSRHVGALPLLMSAERAAALVKTGIDRGKQVIAFPKSLYWLVRASRLAPWQVNAVLGAGLRFHVGRK